jgi:glycosyltransferase involved in cell wall biosynthesis
MTKLKFLMTTTFYPPYHIGGDAVHVKYLADELARQGHEVHVMFSVDAYQIKRGKVSKPDIEPAPVYLHPLQSPRGRLEPLLVYLLGKSGYFSKEFDQLVEEICPDVVHHHNISLLGYDLLRKRGQYLNLYTAHDYWLICQQNSLFKNNRVCNNQNGLSCAFCALALTRPPQLWRQGNAFTEVIKDIDLAIAPSSYVGSVLSQKLGFPLVTIPNFVPPPPEPSRPAEFPEYFLFVGVLERHKGIVELVNIFKDWGQEICTHLVVVGTGSLEKHLRTYVAENDLRDVVHILGWCPQDRVYSLLYDARALVMPSLWPENCPLVALEALSMGTPVVASNIGGLPEIAGLQGERFVGDLDNLKEALIKVRTVPPNRKHIKDVYQQHFSPERFLHRYLELIEDRLPV